MADFSIDLPDGFVERLSRALDAEGRIPRALDALGPVAGRDVLLADEVDGVRARQLRELGGRVRLGGSNLLALDAPDASADVLVSFWPDVPGFTAEALAEAGRTVRPGGRLLAVHDYGRDDVADLRGRDRPEYGAWSKRNGPFLASGFKVRVVHCFWTFQSMDDCSDFLGVAFGDAGRAVATRLKRPRLSYNVAMYHRSVEEPVPAADRDAARAAAR